MFAGHAAHHRGPLGEEIGDAMLCADVTTFLGLGGGWWGGGVGDGAASAGEEGAGLAVVVWDVAPV